MIIFFEIIFKWTYSSLFFCGCSCCPSTNAHMRNCPCRQGPGTLDLYLPIPCEVNNLQRFPGNLRCFPGHQVNQLNPQAPASSLTIPGAVRNLPVTSSALPSSSPAKEPLVTPPEHYSGDLGSRFVVFDELWIYWKGRQHSGEQLCGRRIQRILSLTLCLWLWWE